MKYDYTKIENYCNEIEKISIDMQKQLDEIKSIINTVGSNWTGEASDNYLSKFNKISLNFDDFYNELNACKSFLLKSSDRIFNIHRVLQPAETKK